MEIEAEDIKGKDEDAGVEAEDDEGEAIDVEKRVLYSGLQCKGSYTVDHYTL